MPHIVTDSQWNQMTQELAEYHATGLSPADVKKLTECYDDDYAPRPLIMRSIPTIEQFFNEE